jgi:hypothetical protein
MDKIDFKKMQPELYRPSAKDFAPAMQFVMVGFAGLSRMTDSIAPMRVRF